MAEQQKMLRIQKRLEALKQSRVYRVKDTNPMRLHDGASNTCLSRSSGFGSDLSEGRSGTCFLLYLQTGPRHL